MWLTDKGWRAIVRCVASLTLWGLCVLATTASGSVIAVPRSAFPITSTSIDFSSFSIGTDLNDIALLGVSFSYTSNGVPERGVVEIQGGPGATNNINSPSAVSTGDNAGTVVIDLSGSASLFGYGYALLAFSSVNAATTISLFSGSTFIDTLTYSAVPDPLFAGGFAGIQSTDPFNHVEIGFNADAAPAFAFNQVILADASSQVPEPKTNFLVLSGVLLYSLCAIFKEKGHVPNHSEFRNPASIP